MPLSPPVERTPIHRRLIDINGYQRADGLFDIEASLVDTKSYPFHNLDRGGAIQPGEPLHGMWIRMTVGDDMVIRACEASTDFAPYAVCPGGAANFGALAGVSCGPGFNRVVRERLGGVKGCTHLRELMAQVATVAYQTIGPLRWRKALEARDAAIARGEKPAPYRRSLPVNSCHAYDEHGPVVQRFRQEAEE
jgi:hypothetical protein